MVCFHNKLMHNIMTTGTIAYMQAEVGKVSQTCTEVKVFNNIDSSKGKSRLPIKIIT